MPYLAKQINVDGFEGTKFKLIHYNFIDPIDSHLQVEWPPDLKNLKNLKFDKRA